MASTPTDPATDATRLVAWRERRGWSQADAARETGYSLSAWQSYEQGRRTIPPRVWVLLSALDHIV